jgi:tRNA-specific adenosine deaminase 3
MCSMALLHSRVKEVFFLVPMGRTGGCGGAACVPKLEGVNHRFAIGRWKEGAGGFSTEELEIDQDTDS